MPPKKYLSPEQLEGAALELTLRAKHLTQGEVMLKASLDQTYGPYRNPLTGKFCDEQDYETAVSDVRHIRETIEGLWNPTEHVDCDGDGYSCDCFVSETIMLSTGYAEAYREGEVIQSGKVIYTEDSNA